MFLLLKERKLGPAATPFLRFEPLPYGLKLMLNDTNSDLLVFYFLIDFIDDVPRRVISLRKVLGILKA